MVIAVVELLNPISLFPIREFEFKSIKEMNAFLASVAKTRLYNYRIIGTETTTVDRDAGYLPIAA